MKSFGENKIRIILGLEDLKENNIDLHSFMSNSIETQDLFFSMLEKAEAEMGFVTKNYRLMIEAIVTSDYNFILTVTRTFPEEMQNKKVKTKRKLSSPSKLLSIYCFDTFDDFSEFCTYLSSSYLNAFINKFKKSSLYIYNDRYYLVLYNVSLDLNNFKSFHLIATEFGLYLEHSDLFERKLIEHGKNVIQTDAINTCLKHFK